jgi:hypothetical protein
MPACVVEGAKLNGDAGADADERGESAFVEGEGPFVGEDLSAAVEGGGVLVGGLKADFYDVWWGWWLEQSCWTWARDITEGLT